MENLEIKTNMYYFYIYMYFIIFIPILAAILMYSFGNSKSLQVIPFVKTSLTWFGFAGLFIGIVTCILIQ